jgi:CRISPR-associated protein Cmr5
MKETLEQRRARHAWQKAQEGIQKHGKDYVNVAKGLPALIMNSGLMQTLAFLHQKGGAHEQLAGHLRDWLHDHLRTPRDFENCMQALFVAQARDFQRITTESLAWLKWLRQMASALQGD